MVSSAATISRNRRDLITIVRWSRFLDALIRTLQTKAGKHMEQKPCGSFDQSDLSTRDEIGSRPPVWRSSGLAGGKCTRQMSL
jgi:hypothetical protein